MRKQQVLIRPRETEPTETSAPVSGCHHRWIVETPRGPASKGVCAVCHVERLFPNYIEDPYPHTDWIREVSSLGDGWKHGAAAAGGKE
ncbi:MAG: hypothetical protein Q7T26_08905 [Dehalococcoidia bacterium]|nr:hypothetical protein [Dehalococcoidia bacterium]